MKCFRSLTSSYHFSYKPELTYSFMWNSNHGQYLHGRVCSQESPSDPSRNRTLAPFKQKLLIPRRELNYWDKEFKF